MCANPQCRKPLPYKSPRRYCCRACANQIRAKAVDVYEALRLLDGTLTLDGAALALGISKNHLLDVFREHRVVRIDGSTHRPGRYAIQHWKNPRQLSFF